MPTLEEALNARLTADTAAEQADRLARNNAHGWPGLPDLDKAVDRARTDPAYLDSLAPYERAAVERRMANLDHRTSKGADQ